MSPRPGWSLLLLSTLAGSCAALDWKTDTVSLATTPFQLTQDVVFEFRNNGPKPVAVLDVQTNCDCLAASADQKTYAAGASGTIKARFTIGDRVGFYERIVTLVTDESPTPVRLTARFEVPEIATLAPRSVTWQAREAATDKIVELTSPPGIEIVFTEAQTTNDSFTTRLEMLAAGQHYRLHVKPRSTGQPASAAIRIFGREKSGHDVVVSAYANIQ